MVTKAKGKTQKIWVVGDKKKGISLEDMARKKGHHSWYLKYWRNGRLGNQRTSRLKRKLSSTQKGVLVWVGMINQASLSHQYF